MPAVTPADYFRENLPRWSRDVVAFAEETIRIVRPDTGRMGPLVLEEHQKEWLREATRRERTGTRERRERGDGVGQARLGEMGAAELRPHAGQFTYHTVVASWPKREGKSLCVAILVAWRMCCFDNQHCVVLANSERQAASVIYDELIGFFANSPVLMQTVRSEDVERKKLTVSMTGNTCVCVPCNQRTVQGIAVTGILAVDEVHAAEDISAYNYLAAQTEMVNAQVAVSSQAGTPDESNAVWRLYQASQTTGSDVYFSYSDEHISPWGKDLARRQRAQLTPAEYDKLHRNGWVGLGEKLFAADLVDDAAMGYAEPQTAGELEELVKAWGFTDLVMDIGLGLDRAGVGLRGDRSVLTAVARFSDPAGILGAQYRVVRVIVFRTGDEAEVLAGFRELRAIVGPNPEIIMEAYGCSDLVGKVRGATTEAPTTRRQHEIYTALYRTFKEGRIGYPERAGTAHDRDGHATSGLLKSELIGFEYGFGRAAIPQYGTQSGHDDTVYSLAWAVEAVAEVMIGMVSRAEDYVISGGGYVAEYA
jgi:hypothetical protein